MILQSPAPDGYSRNDRAYIPNLGCMHRRPNMRGTRSRGRGGAPQIQFSKLVSSVPVLLAVQSDMGVTLNGSTVSAWADQSGNDNHFSQGTAAAQPTYAATALNGKPTITFDGSNDEMSSAGPNLPAPGTTPTFLWGVFRQVSWTLNEIILAANSASSTLIFQSTATPQVAMSNGLNVNANSGAAVGSWVRFEALFTASTSDYLKLGGTTVTGASAGNNDPAAGFHLGRNFPGTLWSNVAFAAFMICGGNPSAAEKATLSGAVTAKYGASVGV